MAKFLTLALLSLVWGTTWLAIKFTLDGFPPFAGATFRFAIALFLLFVWARFRNISLRLPPDSFRPLVISAVLLYLLDYGLIYWGEQYLNSGVTAVFFATFPLFTGLVATFVMRNESFSFNRFLGIFVGFLGVVIVFYDQLLQTNFSTMTTIASVAILISAISTAFSVVIVKKHLSAVDPVALNVHQMCWGVLILLICSTAMGELPQLRLVWPAIWATLYLGLVGSAIAFVLYYGLLQKMSATSLSYIIYVTPLVAIFAGWLVLGEPITLKILIGTAIVFAGIAISQIGNTASLGRKFLLRLKGRPQV